MATNNQVNVGLSGASGTGSFAGTNSPGFTTPTLGAASATSVTFSSTTGIIGTTTNDSAAAGSVGQLISSVIPDASHVSINNNTKTDMTSITLTAGDWDVWGNIFFQFTGANTQCTCWVSGNSATLPDPSLYCQISTGGNNSGMHTPTLRVSVNTNTTYYISGLVQFSTGAANMCGGIYARRRR